MKTNYFNTIALSILLLAVVLCSCSEDFLEKKPIKAQVVPASVSELEALLNNTEVMNNAPGLGILGVDDYFMTNSAYLSISDPFELNAYLWQPELYKGNTTCNDWTAPYKQIFYANTVLDALTSLAITDANRTSADHLRGRALFHRAWAHYQLAQFFCQPYSEANRDQVGIPLRLSATITTPVVRASIGATYDLIVKDLNEAASLLPVNVQAPSVASQATAKSLLAIVAMNMDNYTDADKYASEALALNGTLMDYNTLLTTSVRPVPLFNKEVSFHATSFYFNFNFLSQTYMDTVLYQSYHANDLRKGIFFRLRATNRYTFKGNYSGSASLFVGIANNEIYLTRAEARARTGNLAGALSDLNALLVKRWKTGTFTPYSSTNAEEVLGWIMKEKTKEMVFCRARWSDMRRWNKEPNYQRTMARKLNGIIYTLPPNDNRYVYPIPPEEIALTHIEQNPR